MKMEFKIVEMKELENGGSVCCCCGDAQTKTYLINYAILDILQKQLDNIDKLHKEEYKNED